jgi:hypothetical protein
MDTQTNTEKARLLLQLADAAPREVNSYAAKRNGAGDWRMVKEDRYYSTTLVLLPTASDIPVSLFADADLSLDDVVGAAYELAGELRELAERLRVNQAYTERGINLSLSQVKEIASKDVQVKWTLEIGTALAREVPNVDPALRTIGEMLIQWSYMNDPEDIPF